MEVTFNKCNLHTVTTGIYISKTGSRILTLGFYLETVLVLKNTSNVCTLQQHGAFV